MTDAVEVKLGAQTGEVKQQLDATAQSVQASLARMADALQKFTDQNKRTRDESRQATADIGRQFAEMKERIAGSVERVRSTIERVRGFIVGLSTLIAGGMAWKEAIDSTVHLQHEIETLERVLGQNSTQATNTAVRLKLAGSSADEFATMALHLGRQIKADSEEFDRLGVKTKDASGNLLPMEQIMRNVYETMLTFRSGADQNMVALTLTGRSAKDFADVMENLERVEKRAIELQQQLGIEMGPERQAQIKAYKVEVAAFGVVLEYIALRISEQVMPNLQQLASWMVSEGPRAADAIVTAFKWAASATSILSYSAQALGVTFAATLDMMAAAAKGRFGEIKGIILAAAQTIDEAKLRTVDALDALWGKVGAIAGKPGVGGAPSGSRVFTPKPVGPGGDTSIMSTLETELKRQRDAYERMKLEQGSFEQWSAEQTSAYWKNVLDTAQLSAKDREAVLGKYYDAERELRLKAFAGEIAALDASMAQYRYNYDERVRIAQEAYQKIAKAFGADSPQAQAAARKITDEQNRQAEQAQRLAEIESRAAEARATHDADMESLATAQKLAMREISTAQSLQLEARTEDRLYAIKRDAMERLRALEANGPNDPAKIAQINAQIEQLAQQHEERLTQIQNQAILERNKYVLQAQQALETALGDFLANLGDKTKTLKEKLLDLVSSVERAIGQLLARQAAESLFGGGTAGGGFLGSILSSLFGGGAAPIPSFAVGTNYVPRDGLAMIHRGEAIIPAAQNRGGFGGMSVTNHFAITGPVDRRTQDQIALAVSRSIAQATYRNG